MTAAADTSAPTTTRADRLRLLIQPVLVLIVAGAMVFWAFDRDLTATQCDFGEVFTTDGRIAALNLTVLEDDKQFFAHYNPSVTMKRAFFQALPEIAQVTAPVTAALTNEAIIELNEQVDVEGKDPSIVARDWMVSKGFVTAAS